MWISKKSTKAHRATMLLCATLYGLNCQILHLKFQKTSILCNLVNRASKRDFWVSEPRKWPYSSQHAIGLVRAVVRCKQLHLDRALWREKKGNKSIHRKNSEKKNSSISIVKPCESKSFDLKNNNNITIKFYYLRNFQETEWFLLWLNLSALSSVSTER